MKNEPVLRQNSVEHEPKFEGIKIDEIVYLNLENPDPTLPIVGFLSDYQGKVTFVLGQFHRHYDLIDEFESKNNILSPRNWTEASPTDYEYPAIRSKSKPIEIRIESARNLEHSLTQYIIQCRLYPEANGQHQEIANFLNEFVKILKDSLDEKLQNVDRKVEQIEIILIDPSGKLIDETITTKASKLSIGKIITLRALILSAMRKYVSSQKV